MKLHSLIYSRTAVAAACGLMLTAGIVTTRAKADAWDKKTILTVNEPIQVKDTVLEPGKYVLKLYNSDSQRHIVQIFNGDQSHIINTVMAIPKQRMDPTGKTEFTFWETPAGSPRALRAWFYPGDTIGQEFPYPTHVKEMAMVNQQAPVSVESSTPAAAAEQPQAEPPSQPQTNAEVTPEPTPTEPTPAETPQATPSDEQTPAPAEQPARAVAPAAPVEQQPAELPKTGSSYPLIGLAGLGLVGISGLLRRKQSA